MAASTTTTKSNNKALGVKAKETSSAATNYLDASIDWLKKQGSKTVEALKHPVATATSLKDGYLSFLKNIMSTLKGVAKDVKTIASELSKYRSLLSAQNLIKTALDWFKGGKDKVNNFIGTVIKIKGQVMGVLNTNEGKGLLAFLGVSGGILAGGWFLGVPAESLQFVLRTSQYFYTHDWNKKDEDYLKDIDSQITALYGNVGETLGTALASFVTGGVFKLPKVQINMTKVTILWRALNEEAREEMLQSLKSLARTAYRGALRILFNVFYPQVRKMVKRFFKDNPTSPLLKLIPGGKQTIDQWGVGKSWSLAEGFVNPKIEKLQDNPATRGIGDLLENFIDSFGDGLQDFLPELVRQPIA